MTDTPTKTKRSSKKKPLRLATKQVHYLSDSEWDAFVSEVYGKPYCLQQQDDCYPNGSTKRFTVDAKDVGVAPNPDYWVHPRDYCFEIKPTDSLDDIEEQGVGLDAWLARDPKEPLPVQVYDHELELFWQHNFYPVFDDVVTDLASRGLLEPGEYVIDISW